MPFIVWSVPLNTSYFDYTNDGLKFGIDLMYTWQGAKFNQVNTVDTLPCLNYNFNTKIQYLQITMIFEGKFPAAKKVDFALDFGVIPAFKLSLSADITDNVSAVVVAEDLEIPTTFVNLFLSAGAGAVFHFSEGVCLFFLFI